MHPTALRPDDRRNQILDCALEVVACKGFHEASIADICSPARIARGTLYQYFTDKRDVLAALIERSWAASSTPSSNGPVSSCPPT
jgi:AcrR family transcriptional regulator